MSKTLLITGITHNSIGLSTIKYILTRPFPTPTKFTLFLLQRDPKTEASKSALSTLQDISPSSEFHVLPCDLASPASIHDAVAAIKKSTKELDIAILNAGAVFGIERKLDVGKDNKEVDESMQVNHLGHFLLLSLVKDLIRERLVFVGSSLHRKTSPTFLASLAAATTSSSSTSFPLPPSDISPWQPMQAYARSKLMTALCLQHWQDMFDSRAQQSDRHAVEVCMVSPGFVPESGLGRRRGGLLGQFFMKWVMHYAPFARGIDDAGRSVGSVALNEQVKELRGSYLGVEGKQERLADCCYVEESRRIAWNYSCETTGVEQQM